MRLVSTEATLKLAVILIMLAIVCPAHALIADGTPLFTWNDPQMPAPGSFKLSCDGATLTVVGGLIRQFQTTLLSLSPTTHNCYVIAQSAPGAPVLTENSNTVTFSLAVPKPPFLLKVTER